MDNAMDIDDEKQAEEEPEVQEEREEDAVEEVAEDAAVVPLEDDDIIESPSGVLPSQVKPSIEEKPPLPKQRLFIERITCENFKSYYGVKEVGPFHKVNYGT